MGKATRLSFSFKVSLLLIFCPIFKILRISRYATASTYSAAYIIGGYDVHYRISTIAQYKNNKWLKIGDLKEEKYCLSAIFHDGEYFIVGGYSDSGR